MKKSILIIDDDKEILRMLDKFLTASGYEVKLAPTLGQSSDLLSARHYDAVLIDQTLPDGKGIDIIAPLRSSSPDTAIVVITGASEIPLAVEAMRRGADNFLTKPVHLSELLVFLQKSLDVSSLRRIARNRDILEKKTDYNFGVSKIMEEVMEFARIAMESDHPVLITGETGVGKGVLARWIHENSARRKGSFVEVNCPGFRGELLRSELYGHAKGAFTSAVQEQAGLLEAADGGTLFLDEIGDMSADIQAQFLKVVEDKTYRRLGEIKTRRSDFRLICATNRDLKADSSSGKFRKDLLFRLQILPIHLRPLRERREDIPVFVRQFLGACGYSYRDVAPEVMDYLVAYDWPGNIRELRYVIERAVLLARGRELDLEHFIGIERSHPAGTAGPDDAGSAREREAIQSALAKHGNNVVKAAQALGMSRATLYRRMQRLKKHEH